MTKAKSSRDVLNGLPVERWASQREVAAALGVTDRQVRELEERGLPYRGVRTEKRYPLPHSLFWHEEFKREAERLRSYSRWGAQKVESLDILHALLRYQLRRIEANLGADPFAGHRFLLPGDWQRLGRSNVKMWWDELE